MLETIQMRLPVVTFAEAGGAHTLDEFTFMCVGQGILKRLKEGETVLLIDGKTHTAFGFAEVVKMEKGELRQLCLRFGKDHHCFKTEEEDQVTKGEKLFDWLQSVYGKRIVTPAKKSVALYLKKISYESGPERCIDLWRAQRQEARGHLRA